MLTVIARKHVYHDLRPYVCKFPSCDLLMFTDFHSWLDHELQAHRLEWRCPFCLEPSMSPPVLLETHLKRSHSTETLENRLPAMIDSCKRPKQAISASSWPFCDDAEAKALSLDTNLEKGKVLVPTIVFARQVASHMEQLVLFAIPGDTGDLDDDRAINSNANINSIRKLG